MIACPQCGYDNELGRIFCHACGTKLDLSKIKPPSEGEKTRRRVKRNAVRTVRTVIELIIVGVLFIFILLLCLTPDLKPLKATNDEMAVSDKIHEELETVAASTKAGKVVVSGKDLDTYFNSFTAEKPTGSGIAVEKVAIRCGVNDGIVKIEFLGLAHFGATFDKKLYLRYEGVPQIEGGHFVFKPTAGWFGKLPIAPPLLANTPFFENYVGQLAAGAAEDKALLEKFSSINVTSNSVEFVKNAGSPAH